MNLLDIAIAKIMGGGGDEPTGTKEINITQNGVTTEDVKSYASAKITTNVPNSYAAGDEGKVVSNGALVAQTSKNVISNGTVDTTTNNQVVVNVPSGTPTIQSLSVTQNGTYTAPSGVDGYSPVTVNVSGGGGGAEIETGTWIPSSSSVTREFIPFTNTHSKLPAIVILTFNQNNADYWQNNYVTKFQYIDYYQVFGSGYNTQKDAADGFGYSHVEATAWYSSATNTTISQMMTSHNSSELGDTDKTYPRYFVRENGFYATSDFKSASYHFFKPSSATAGTWNWIAIWV